MAIFESIEDVLTPSRYQVPRLSDALGTLTGNGATIDPESLLSGAIVEVSSGRFRFPVDGATGTAQTDPVNGAMVAVPLLDNNGKVITNVPRGFGATVTIHTGGVAQEGLYIVVGVAPTFSVANSVWSAMQWDAASVNPRAVAGGGGTSGVSAVRAGIGSFTCNTLWSPALIANIARAQTVGTSLRLSSDDSYSAAAGRTTTQAFAAGEGVLFFGVFASLTLVSTQSPEFSIEYWCDPIPPGGRL